MFPQWIMKQCSSDLPCVNAYKNFRIGLIRRRLGCVVYLPNIKPIRYCKQSKRVCKLTKILEVQKFWSAGILKCWHVTNEFLSGKTEVFREHWCMSNRPFSITFYDNSNYYVYDVSFCSLKIASRNEGREQNKLAASHRCKLNLIQWLADLK